MPTGNEAIDDAAGAAAVAPRITLAEIEAMVDREEYHVFDDVLTIGVLTLKNGFKVTGESAAASPQNFNAELGRKIARERAIGKVWPLAGFMLRDELHRGENPRVMRAKCVLSGRSPNIQFAWGKDPADTSNYRFDGERLQFHAVCPTDGGVEVAQENKIFGELTPHFALDCTVRNAAVLASLERGRAYYVDFIPAD